MKSASVYLRQGMYYIHPIGGTSGGGDPCLSMGPVTKLAEDQDPVLLGEQVIASLSLSRMDLPWPTDWKALVQPLLAAAGVKSEATFNKGTKCVRIDLDGETLSLIPSFTSTQEKGFFPKMDKVIQLQRSNALDLGKAVQLAMAMSDL